MAENMRNPSGSAIEIPEWQSFDVFSEIANRVMNGAIYGQAYESLKQFADTYGSVEVDYFINVEETSIFARKIAWDMVTIAQYLTGEQDFSFTKIPVDQDREFRLGVNSNKTSIWCAIGIKDPNGIQSLAVDAKLPLDSDIEKFTMDAVVYPNEIDGSKTVVCPVEEHCNDAVTQRLYLSTIRTLVSTLLEATPSQLSEVKQIQR
jgi:hypothetical protein